MTAPARECQPDTSDGLTSIDRVRLALAMMDTGSSWDLEPEYAEDLLTAYDTLRSRVDELTKARSEEPVAWRWRHVNSDTGSWCYQHHRYETTSEYIEQQALYASVSQTLAMEPTAAQIDAALRAWFSVKPSASESDAVLERSMKAALIAGTSMLSLERSGGAT